MYRLPNFNLVANVWHNGLAGQSLAGPVVVPATIPDVTTVCQLYYPRYGTAGDFALDVDSIQISLRRAGYVQLRMPKWTPVVAPWGAGAGVDWASLDLVELPAGTGRLYLLISLDSAHLGFSNEYLVGVLAQVSNLSAPRQFATGTAESATVWPPVGGGGGGGGGGGPLSWPSGTALAAVYSPPPPPALGVQLPAGTALLGVYSPPPPPALGVQLPAGTAEVAAAKPPVSGGVPTPVGLPAGTAEAAVVGSSGPTPTPGTTCATAGTVSPPATWTTLNSSTSDQWYVWPATVGHLYTVTRTSPSPGNTPGSLLFGSCASKLNVGSFSGSSPSSITYTPSTTGNLYLDMPQSLMGTYSYTISVS